MKSQKSDESRLTRERLRSLPSVDALLSEDRLIALSQEFTRANVAVLVRRRFDQVRSLIAGPQIHVSVPSLSQLVEDVESMARETWSAAPRHVINGTGVIIHTNLGRALLSSRAIMAAQRAGIHFTDLELDLETGGRGSRHDHVASLLSTVTGAERGIAVNNNAAAALLTLSAIAGDGKEVIVSRGEAVEIGGGFRVPDVMLQSGAKLVEVGTTNRTYAHDYENAVGPDTAAILKVHRSNFTITGFTHEDEISKIAEVSKRHGIPLLHDLGSGCLLDTSVYGLEHEPTVQDSLEQGADIVMFSGDKLLGGPQAGLIVGDGSLVERISKHPLARAVRIDKMTLAALNATLIAYATGKAETELRVWKMISASESEMEMRAEMWLVEPSWKVVEGRTVIGGGSAPGQTLPTWRLAIRSDDGAESVAKWMRQHKPAIIGRIEDDTFYLDPRAVELHEQDVVEAALREFAQSAS